MVYMAKLLHRVTKLLRCIPNFYTQHQRALHASTRTPVGIEEFVKTYVKYGYYPVIMGDVFNSRYRVVRKLGWGNYSTVWLVRDESNNTYASLKFMTDTGTKNLGERELEFLRRMRNHDTKHKGYPYVLHLLDSFYHPGPRGDHLCIVTELLSESMQSFMPRLPNERVPIPIVKRATRQLLLAIDYLHNSCDIIHTDIKTSNILFKLKISDSSSLPPVGEMLVGRDADGNVISRYKTTPLSYPLPSDANTPGIWDAAEVALIDMGVSCLADQVNNWSTIIQSPALRAPESCLGAGWGKPADIWSLGCTVFELVMGLSLFPRDISERIVPFLHTYLFGPYPLDMIKKGKFSLYFFNKDGSTKSSVDDHWSLEDEVKGHGSPPDEENFVDFLKLMLQLDPAQRAKPDELLAHRWLL